MTSVNTLQQHGGHEVSLKLCCQWSVAVFDDPIGEARMSLRVRPNTDENDDLAVHSQSGVLRVEGAGPEIPQHRCHWEVTSIDALQTIPLRGDVSRMSGSFRQNPDILDAIQRALQAKCALGILNVDTVMLQHGGAVTSQTGIGAGVWWWSAGVEYRAENGLSKLADAVVEVRWIGGIWLVDVVSQDPLHISAAFHRSMAAALTADKEVLDLMRTRTRSHHSLGLFEIQEFSLVEACVATLQNDPASVGWRVTVALESFATGSIRMQMELRRVGGPTAISSQWYTEVLS